MNSHTVAKMAIGWVGAVLILNIIALRIDLFFLLPWFDTMMHTLGGITLGILGAGWAKVRGYSNRKVLVVGVLVGIAGGVLWEGFEHALDIVFQSDLQPDMPDTMTDIAADTVGSVIGSLLVRARTVLR